MNDSVCAGGPGLGICGDGPRPIVSLDILTGLYYRHFCNTLRGALVVRRHGADRQEVLDNRTKALQFNGEAQVGNAAISSSTTAALCRILFSGECFWAISREHYFLPI